MLGRRRRFARTTDRVEAEPGPCGCAWTLATGLQPASSHGLQLNETQSELDVAMVAASGLIDTVRWTLRPDVVAWRFQAWHPWSVGGTLPAIRTLCRPRFTRGRRDRPGAGAGGCSGARPRSSRVTKASVRLRWIRGCNGQADYSGQFRPNHAEDLRRS